VISELWMSGARAISIEQLLVTVNGTAAGIRSPQSAVGGD
jgi:uncharacterized protein YlxW (UPF0749 family)